MPKYTSFTNSFHINEVINSNYFSTENPIVMGILNITTDSFYDGGKYITEKEIIQQVKKMLDEGAKIIDIGAQSTRPGADLITAKEELRKLLPIIKLLKNKFPGIIISIDTFWAEVAEKCIQEGANMINDISAGKIDEKILEIIAKFKTPYILMHMQGIPLNMQDNPCYNNISIEVFSFFKKRIKLLHEKGINNIILDPGFGFGKNLEHNYQLLNKLKKFQEFKLPILIGVSRKSMIYSALETTPDNALNGTTIVNTIALLNGASILRVHDVKEAYECIKITKLAKSNNY